MKTIDPEKVPEIFRRHGLDPIDDYFVSRIYPNGCCVLTAMYCESRGCDDPSECIGEIRREYGAEMVPSASSERFAQFVRSIDPEMDPLYAEGVANGWDNTKGFDIEYLDPIYKEGWDHGRRAWLACHDFDEEDFD